jgi:hypothetical protein
MRVHVDAPYGLSRAMSRVARALTAHAPASVQVVTRAADADLVLLHTVGYDDTVAAAARLQAAGQRYAVAQYCLRSTQQRHTQAWQRLWAGADLVWSYYDLNAACEADGCEMDPAVNFYMSPLGVDPAFAAGQMPTGERQVDVMTSGYVSTGQEAIWEFALAAERTGRTVKHLGPNAVRGMPRRPAGWTSMLDVTDEVLAAFYGCTKWVSGLRYGEGFEMPCIEGLARGARPVVFDRPDMRMWYEGHAVFVPEAPSEELTCILEAVLAGAPVPVSEAERAAVLRRFAWPGIAAGFWQALGDKKEKVA